MSHGAAAASMPWLSPDLPDGTRAEARMVKPRDKQALIQLTDRPLNLETPIQYLRSDITANDQLFVRYHFPGTPDQLALDNWTLEVKGDASDRTARLTARDLMTLPQAEIIAVCQSAGMRRGLLQPHVPGVQWGHGAVGCATWHGPRLRDILSLVDVSPDAVELWFDCMDKPPTPGVPRFRKSLPMSKVMSDETILATSMNNGPLPLLNGLPARLVVGGWASCYWVKHVTTITVSQKPLNEYWMAEVDRLPKGLFPGDSGFDSQDTARTVPLTDIPVNALITAPVSGDQVERSGFTLRGVAWDKGTGILRVDVSLDGGKSWQSAFLDREIGPWAFRNFSLDTGPIPRGPAEIRVRATSMTKETQPDVWRANPGGYFNNVPQRVMVTAV
jgi:DMSO/TMAO reductase YedYZ molybdopterin-dependent catalytic subunit